MIRAVSSSAIACPPWTWPWWCPMTGQYLTFFWVMLIHMTAIVGFGSVSAARLATLPHSCSAYLAWRIGYDGLLSSEASASGAATASGCTRHPDLFCPDQ